MYKLDDQDILFSEIGKLYTPCNSIDNEVGVIQCAKDRRHLIRISEALNLESINPDRLPIIGLWPYIGLRDIISKKGWTEYISSFIGNQKLFIKWRALYRPLNLLRYSKIEGSVNDFSVKNLILAFGVYRTLKKNEDLKGLFIGNIFVGDLIYSSYIRFREAEKIDYDDFFLFYLVYKCFQVQKSVRSLLSQYKLKFYITSFTSYVQHGVIVREMLNAGVQVYSLGNTKNVIKRHGPEDFSHKLPYWSYLEKSKKLLTKSMYDDAERTLEARMSGQIDRSISYMEKSAYQGEHQDIPFGFIGVLFLHDFLDSPFDYRYWIFDDLYHWAYHSLNLISMSRLPIAIKPHPNQIAGNAKIIKKLKGEFPDLIWLDPQVSNAQLFKFMDVGISVFGTILVELAYHNKIGIAAGDHPAADFEICLQPKTISEYDALLLNVKNISPIKDARDKAITFFASQNYLPNDQEIPLPEIGLDLDWGSSRSLIQWLTSLRSSLS